ncbi:aspartyl-tRNA(Asn)/glutamyl-tRNA(Gln) amidotransferase subunit C [Candidatus Magnetomoraceae bacterium gMMP-1]
MHYFDALVEREFKNYKALFFINQNKAIKRKRNMKITKDEILQVANLARLNLEESDVERLTQEVGDILNYMDMLNQVDTSGIAPTSHAIFMNNAFREDEIKPSIETDAALANAPEKEGKSFIVPRVIG